MKSVDVIECLVRFKFNGGGWAVVKELKPSVGYAGDERRIDLFAIDCQPSKGMHKHAVEVKISRADWLRELKQPLKRRLAMAISNFMWIAAPVGIVKPEELPPMVGLLEVAEDWRTSVPWEALRVAHRAEFRDAVRPTWALVASLLRRSGAQRVDCPEPNAVYVAARRLVEAVDSNHETKPVPMRYTVPWEAVTELRAALAHADGEACDTAKA